MLRQLRDRSLRSIFGAGMGATLADRGIDWLSDETRKAVAKEPVDLTRVTLRPGETYTVIARPPATRADRRLARTSRSLGEAERKLSAATPRQRRAARKLRSAQRHLDRTRKGTRRHRRAAAAEAEAARRFDKAMAPSAKLGRVRKDKARVDAVLDLRREARFRAVRSSSPMSATVYD